MAQSARVRRGGSSSSSRSSSDPSCNGDRVPAAVAAAGLPPGEVRTRAPPAARRPLSAVGEVMAETAAVGTAEEPLLVSAIKGRKVERPPVWLMRQAGWTLFPYKLPAVSYQLLCGRHPSFCERSELVDLVVEISLQPWKAILFSDILTPLPGMNIPFDIVKGKGPVIFDPLRTAAAVNEVREFVPEEWVPYVGQALNILREEGSDTHCFLLRLTMKLPC
uniref:Uroporphyrinogen decarboxylase (URO-D) domain-containing protein n=1 Tax=Oryza meridionalis TaxID=40149 RepID=A0A0E0D086_9ORYZ